MEITSKLMTIVKEQQAKNNLCSLNFKQEGLESDMQGGADGTNGLDQNKPLLFINYLEGH